MDRDEIIQLIIYSLLGIGGVLSLVFTRNFTTLNFVTDNCQTFGGAMITFLKWLIIPVSAAAASFLTLIPFVFGQEKISKILIILELLALTGFAAYFTFYVNADWSVGTLIKIFNTICYIISFLWIMAWVLLIIFIPALIVNMEVGGSIGAFAAIIFTGFLMGCFGHLQFLQQAKLSYSLLTFPVGLAAVALPVITVIILYKEIFSTGGGGGGAGIDYDEIYVIRIRN